MTNSRQHRTWIFGISRRVATTALAMALALTVVATPAAHAQTFTVLHDFTNGQDGAYPEAGLTMDKAGNLYGTAWYGGLGQGTVFKLNKSSGWTFKPLYSFPANESDGARPQARVIVGPNGTLYGTTYSGGASGFGVVFNLRPRARTETVLHNFTRNPVDGEFPGSGDVVFDQGNLYGTTITGGSAGLGAVYELTPSGTESVLYSFAGGNDGSYPYSGVIFDGSGNLYGTTTGGGNEACVGGCGTVYKMTPSGSGWTEEPIYRFTGGSDGAYPYGGLIFDQKGNLYGTTISGGIIGCSGTVFELRPKSDGSWKFKLLYSFNGCGGPSGSLTMDAAGNLYGITAKNDCLGCSTYGDVFELTPSGGGWTYTNLHAFLDGNDGGDPYGSVVLDANGNLYGTAYGWGKYGYGVVWEITP
jgi:uncharacterized repeat protein (TIGR03803 family)